MENFINKEKCLELMNECDRLIESNHFMDEVSKIPVFHGDNDETKVSNNKLSNIVKKILIFFFLKGS